MLRFFLSLSLFNSNCHHLSTLNRDIKLASHEHWGVTIHWPIDYKATKSEIDTLGISVYVNKISPKWPYYRDACQISEWSDKLKLISRGFHIKRHLVNLIKTFYHFVKRCPGAVNIHSNTIQARHYWCISVDAERRLYCLIARFMGPTWGPPGDDRTQVGPMLVTWTLLSGIWHGYFIYSRRYIPSKQLSQFDVKWFYCVFVGLAIVPSHYLNQCWLSLYEYCMKSCDIHSSGGNFTRGKLSILGINLTITYSMLQPYLPRVNELNLSYNVCKRSTHVCWDFYIRLLFIIYNKICWWMWVFSKCFATRLWTK